MTFRIPNRLFSVIIGLGLIFAFAVSSVQAASINLRATANSNRVGGFLTVPASHTTGHTDHVPRRFPLRCNARCLSVRGVSPWAMNQSRFMASVAW